MPFIIKCITRQKTWPTTLGPTEMDGLNGFFIRKSTVSFAIIAWGKVILNAFSGGNKIENEVGWRYVFKF